MARSRGLRRAAMSAYRYEGVAKVHRPEESRREREARQEHEDGECHEDGRNRLNEEEELPPGQQARVRADEAEGE